VIGSAYDEDKMDGKKRRQISSIAETIREAFKMPSPIDMEKAVSRLGGRIEAARGDKEATIGREDESFVIRLDGTKPFVRRTFSLAHELGHLVLHMGFGQPEKWHQSEDYEESYARSGWSEEEYEANEFAASFLMPSAEFRQVAANATSIKFIAEHFGVSVDAALTRGRFLGIYSWS
jgi:Zn-dependent peptidase ImmA (M78 family)